MKNKALTILVLSMLLGQIAISALAIDFNTEISTNKDDWMMTETYIVRHNTGLIPLKDPNFDIYAGLIFRNLTIPSNAYINNATLQVYNEFDHPDSTTSMVTVYGIDNPSIELVNDSSWFSELTDASVNWNVSGIDGAGWYQTDVSDIVREIFSKYAWSSGSNLGLAIFGANGTLRNFEARDRFGRGARLNVTYGLPPSTVNQTIQTEAGLNESDGYFWDFWKMYGECEIWNVSVPSGEFDYVYNVFGNNTYYSQIGDLLLRDFVNDSTYDMINNLLVLERDSAGDLYFLCLVEKLRNNGTAYTEDHLVLFRSQNAGASWTEWFDLTDQYNSSGSFAYDQKASSMLIDDNRIWFWLTWAEDGHTKNGIAETWLELTNTSWRPSIVWLSNEVSNNHSNAGDPSGFIDSDNNRYVVWSQKNATYAKTQIWLKEWTGTWSEPLRASENDDGNNIDATVSTYDWNGTQRTVVCWQKQLVVGDRYVYSNKWNGTGWGGQLDIFDGGTINQDVVSMVDVNGTVHAFWKRWYATDFRIRYARLVKGVIPWTAPATVSHNNAISMSFIEAAIDDSNTIKIIYSEMESDPYQVWSRSRNYAGTWTTQQVEQNISGITPRYPNMRVYCGGESNVWVAVFNGSYVGTCYTPECVYVECDKAAGGPDPEDPDPSGWGWTPTVTRFNLKIGLFIIAICCILGPILHMCWKRPDAWVAVCAILIITTGLGLLVSLSTF